MWMLCEGFWAARLKELCKTAVLTSPLHSAKTLIYIWIPGDCNDQPDSSKPAVLLLVNTVTPVSNVVTDVTDVLVKKVSELLSVLAVYL